MMVKREEEQRGWGREAGLNTCDGRLSSRAGQGRLSAGAGGAFCVRYPALVTSHTCD